MLILKYHKQPYWIDLIEGLRWKVQPFSSMILERARDNIAGQDNGEGEGQGQVDRVTGRGEYFAQLSKEVAKLVVLDWEGVEDEAGQPVPVSVETVDAVMHFPLVSQMFQDKYMADGMRMGFEKKGSAPLPSGTLAGAQDTAAGASQSTASDAPPPSKTPAPLH